MTQALRLAAVRLLPTLVLACLTLNLRLQEAIALPRLTRLGKLVDETLGLTTATAGADCTAAGVGAGAALATGAAAGAGSTVKTVRAGVP